MREVAGGTLDDCSTGEVAGEERTERSQASPVLVPHTITLIIAKCAEATF